MIHRLIFFFSFSVALVHCVRAQHYTSSSVFAHNDYVHPVPFYTSYARQVGFIEADVFLQQGDLLVAHTSEEIRSGNTLEALYLKPVNEYIIKNNGYPYADTTRKLTLMIDLKTEGGAALEVLVRQLNKYPKLLASTAFQIAVSGAMPDPSLWDRYPSFIHFDGRPGVNYTTAQLQRVIMISTGFYSYATWNGKGVIVKEERKKIQSIIERAHALHKPVRFWAMPEGVNSWIAMMDLKIDIIGTDDVEGATDFIATLRANAFQNTEFHEVYVPKKPAFAHVPKNIILLIGDGMSFAQIYSGYTANKGKLSLFNIPDIGFSITTSADSYITDSAAGATAMASGSKTNNRYVGVDSAGKSLPSITEQLKAKGFKTALISAGDITDATPAAFYAHQPERSWSEQIAQDFMTNTTDILIGGGVKAFAQRKDNRNLLTELSRKGYSVAASFSSLDTIRHAKFVVLDDDAVISKINGRGDFLSRSLIKSYRTLSSTAKPFFIMAEGAQIDYGGHNNNVQYVVREMLDFDKAVGEAMKLVDQDKETLLIITADHETGGLSLVGGSITKGQVTGNFSTTDHTAVMVPVFSYGPGSDNFTGVFQNTEIHSKIITLLSKKK